jgi:hypothetical protein
MRKIEEILSRKKAEIVKRCFDLTVEAYPVEASLLLKREKDRFLNPVGFTIRSEIENIFDEVAGAMDPKRLADSLTNIIRIRAVQNFTPSEAISFVYLLKRSIREELGAKTTWDVGRGTWDEKSTPEIGWAELDGRIDRVALLAFDVYTQCREKIHEIRMKEIKAFRGR